MKRFAAVAMLTIMLAACEGAWAQVVVTCPRAPAPPILDGNATPDEWVAAGRLSPFVLLHNEGLPREATDVRVMHDDEALYVAAIMYDSDTDHLRAEATETDGEVYRDDCFELFIDAIGSGDSYVHLVINPIGTRFDELAQDRAAAVVWNAGVAVRQSEWSVELSVPFTRGRPPAEGSVWKIGAARHRAGLEDVRKPRNTRNTRKLEEYSSWNGFVDGFHEPARFGQMRFGGPQASFSLVDVGAMKLGRNTAMLFADNATGEPLQFKTNVRVHGRDRSGHFFAATKFVAPPGARTPVEAPYEVTQDGDGSVLISVTDARGQPVYRTAAIPLHLPAVAGELFAVEAALVEAGREWSRIPDSEAKEALRAELNALTDQRDELNSLVQQRASLSLADLKEVETALRDLHQRIGQLTMRMQAAAQSGGTLGSFAAAPVDSLTKVFPDQPPTPTQTEARIEACRNEWESFQITVVSLSGQAVKLSVRAGDLKGPSAVIPSRQMQVHLVGNVPAADHLTPQGGAAKRLWPDILTPALAETETIAIPPDETRALWVAVRLPADAVPGEYVGTITLSDDEGSTADVPDDLRGGEGRWPGAPEGAPEV